MGAMLMFVSLLCCCAAMIFNLAILILQVVGLMVRGDSWNTWDLLFKDGVVLYLIAFSCNALPAVSVICRQSSPGRGLLT